MKIELVLRNANGLTPVITKVFITYFRSEKLPTM